MTSSTKAKPKKPGKVDVEVSAPMRQINIISFGWDFGLSPEAQAVTNYQKPSPWSCRANPFTQDWLYDTRRDIRNPWVMPELRALGGTHADVLAFLEDCAHVAKRVADLASQIVGAFYGSTVNIWIGCKRGRHRSVAMAILLQQEFHRKYGDNYTVTVTHRDVDKKWVPVPKVKTVT